MSRALRVSLIAAGAIAVVVALAFGPLVVSNLLGKKAAADPALATVARRSFPVVAAASGTLLPQSEIDVNFATSGQLKEVDAQIGRVVTRGEVLAKLDDSGQLVQVQAAQAAVSSAEGAVSAAQVALTAAENGTSKEPVSSAKVQLANAELQLANAKAQLQRAQSDEAKTVLTAPSPGTVLQINGDVGENVSAGGTHPGGGMVPGAAAPAGGVAPFIVIGNGTSYEVAALFDQGDASELQPAQPGTASFDALPGLSLSVHLASVATVASQVNGVPEFAASVVLDQADPRLRSGMTATVSITIAQASNVLAVPNQAVYTVDNAAHVDVWFHGAAVPTPIVIGKVGDQLTEITSGLSAGQQVLLPGPQGLPTPPPGAAATPGPS